MKTEDQKGFTCECGTFNPFSMYALTNDLYPVGHACKCGIRWTVQHGIAKKETRGFWRRLFG